MKKHIKFDDKNYMTLITVFLAIMSIILLILTFNKVDLAVKIIEIILVIIFIAISILMQYIGILFDYKKKKIVIMSSSKWAVIDMSSIKQIRLIEIHKERKNRFYGIWSRIEGQMGIVFEPKYVYREGKIFNIEFTMKNGIVVTIFYGMLYKSRSAERVKKQENKINESIQLFIGERSKTMHE